MVGPELLLAWLAGRSVARRLPAPVADRGGFRVDTNTDIEVKRWVFASFTPGLGELGRVISEPRHTLKLCGTIEELGLALPGCWEFEPLAYLMTTDGHRGEAELPEGYSIMTERDGRVSCVQVFGHKGDLAASGYSGEVAGGFVYDRIVTAPSHQRKGLGRVVMQTLHSCRLDKQARELLVATEVGRKLYEALGWRVISPYATAFIPRDVHI